MEDKTGATYRAMDRIQKQDQKAKQVEIWVPGDTAPTILSPYAVMGGDPEGLNYTDLESGQV